MLLEVRLYNIRIQKSFKYNSIQQEIKSIAYNQKKQTSSLIYAW